MMVIEHNLALNLHVVDLGIWLVIPYSTKLWQEKTLARVNFGGVGTARTLAKKTLAFGRGKAHSTFELTRPDNFLVDWQ